MTGRAWVRGRRAAVPSPGRQAALRRTETRVWKAFCLGQELDLKAWDGARPGDGHGAVVRTSRVPAVRAQVLAAMLRGDGGSLPSPRLVLTGAHVTGQLDLSYARIGHPIILRRCVFDEPVSVAEARLNSLILDGSVFPGLDAHNLELDGNLALRNVSCSGTQRPVPPHERWSWLSINPSLDVTGAVVTGPGARTPDGQTTTVTGREGATGICARPARAAPGACCTTRPGRGPGGRTEEALA